MVTVVTYCAAAGLLLPPVLWSFHHAHVSFIEQCGLGDEYSPAECEARWLRAITR